ncbi:hypothetical protein [Streptomyces sp. NPDC001657]|uniref:hypothetical protein n=1 Tax=Streptomyces sp. NPDC001657 TaxID=3154522 RepID=UPI00331FCA78
MATFGLATCVFSGGPGGPPAIASPSASSPSVGSNRADNRLTESDADVVHPLSVQDFNDYCKDQGYGQGVTTIGEDAYSIRCKNDDGSLQEFANDEDIHNFVEGVCGAAYPKRNVIDRLRTMANTYSAWECMDTVSYAGVPDLQGWCEAKGLNLVASDNAKYPAYRWFCVNSSRSHVEGIPMDQVCTWQYGPDALDRLADANATEIGDAWDCRYVR